MRVPFPFRHIVEGSEPFYFSARKLDRLRLRIDPTLRRTYSSASKILIVGKYMLDLIPQEFHNKTEVLLEAGIDLDELPKTIKDETGGIFKILYVGRIVPYKGLEFLINALSKINKRLLSKTQLNIVGDGGEYALKCKKISNELGLDNYVKFHGSVPHDKICYWYANSDVFCFPSLAETSGNVILEAMAMGLPVISVNCGGPSEILDQETGILIDPISPEFLEHQIASAIEGLASNREQIVKLGTAARIRVFNEFSWDAKGRKLKAVYEGIIDV